jgi:hypothetical protein
MGYYGSVCQAGSNLRLQDPRHQARRCTFNHFSALVRADGQINTGKMLENNIPVFLVTFATQEQLLFRNAKSGEAVVGSENGVESCRYALVLTRVETELENPLTGGWKVVEVSTIFVRGAHILMSRWLDEEPRALSKPIYTSMMQHHSILPYSE